MILLDDAKGLEFLFCIIGQKPETWCQDYINRITGIPILCPGLAPKKSRPKIKIPLEN